jgi:hypothetical protein
MNAGIDMPWLWTDPLGERSLSVLIHETAHHLNAHHGHDFHQEEENLAGRAARLMLTASPNVHQVFGPLLTQSDTPTIETDQAAATSQDTSTADNKEIHTCFCPSRSSH